MLLLRFYGANATTNTKQDIVRTLADPGCCYAAPHSVWLWVGTLISDPFLHPIVCPTLSEHIPITHVNGHGTLYALGYDNHQGELATKVRYFGAKSANVPTWADGHLTC